MSRSDVEIVEPLPEHVDAIAANVRPADRDELWAAGHTTPTQAMLYGMEHSTLCYVGLFNGVAACMVGVAPASLLAGKGIPWMVGTSALERYQFMFLRQNKPFVAMMLEQYETLENYVDERNRLAQRWLRWLGFELASVPVPYGKDKMPFRRFTMTRSGAKAGKAHV